MVLLVASAVCVWVVGGEMMEGGVLSEGGEAGGD